MLPAAAKFNSLESTFSLTEVTLAGLRLPLFRLSNAKTSDNLMPLPMHYVSVVGLRGTQKLTGHGDM